MSILIKKKKKKIYEREARIDRFIDRLFVAVAVNV